MQGAKDTRDDRGRRRVTRRPSRRLPRDCSPSRFKTQKSRMQNDQGQPVEAPLHPAEVQLDEPIDWRERPGLGPDQRRHHRPEHGPAHGRLGTRALSGYVRNKGATPGVDGAGTCAMSRRRL